MKFLREFIFAEWRFFAGVLQDGNFCDCDIVFFFFFCWELIFAILRKSHFLLRKGNQVQILKKYGHVKQVAVIIVILLQ